MKKILIASILILTLTFSLTGCDIVDDAKDKVMSLTGQDSSDDDDDNGHSSRNKSSANTSTADNDGKNKDSKDKDSSNTEDYEIDNAQNTESQPVQEEPAVVEYDEKTDIFNQGTEIIAEYGTGYYNESKLAFQIIPGTVKEFNDYYRVDVYYRRPVKILSPSPGVKYTIVTNALTGDSFVGRVDANYIMRDDYGTEYNIYGPDSENEYVLYYGSDDLLYCTFFQGVLRIDKSAITGIAINNDYHNVNAEELSAYGDYNKVIFDMNGYVTELVFVGD